MTINWFPGHMHKARKEITAILPKVDFLIELVDARIPYSSGNPLIAELRDQKPLLKLLNKSDLADPVVTQTWIDYFEAENGVKAIPFDARNAQHARQLLHRGAKLVGREPNPLKPITTMVVGIPNVGKSTLINGMVGRAVAQTGNVPAVTKRQQRIAVDQNYILLDTPGFLWPKLWPATCGYRLAVTGAIKDAIVDYADIAWFAADFLRAEYGEAVSERYRLDELPDDATLLLEEIARRRGCIGKGGVVRTEQVSELLIRELRAGRLGKLSLETPDVIEEEVRLATLEKARLEEEKRLKKELRQQKKRRR